MAEPLPQKKPHIVCMTVVSHPLRLVSKHYVRVYIICILRYGYSASLLLLHVFNCGIMPASSVSVLSQLHCVVVVAVRGIRENCICVRTYECIRYSMQREERFGHLRINKFQVFFQQQLSLVKLKLLEASVCREYLLYVRVALLLHFELVLIVSSFFSAILESRWYGWFHSCVMVGTNTPIYIIIKNKYLESWTSYCA